MATIRKTTSGRFQAIVRKKDHPPISQTFESKKEAQAWATQREADIESGRAHGPEHAHRLGDLIKQYKHDRLDKLRAKDDRERFLDLWLTELGDVRLAEITPSKIAQTLRAYAAKPIQRRVRKGRDILVLERERSSQTVRHFHSALSALLDYAQRDLHWVDINRAKQTRRAAPAPARVRWLTEEQRDRLLDACRQSLNPDLYTVVLLALTSGARQDEVVGLRWSQVDYRHRCAWLSADDTKTAEARVMPLVPEVIELLKARTRTLHVDHVFASPTKRGQPRNMRQAWDVARKRAGLPDFRFHDLRHSAATELLRAGVDSRVVAAVLGHKTLAMVKRYAHVAPQLVVEAAERAVRNRA